MARRASKPEATERERGRPRLYESAEEFSAKVDEYFASVSIPSIAGLSYFLGFCDKQSFSEYEKYGEDFSLTVKRARLRMETDRVLRLNDRNKFTPGTIFDLKNNYGYTDKQEIEHSGSIGLMDRINRGRSRS